MTDFVKLAAPFPPSAISWRVGAGSGERGMALAYLDARDVMDRLDEVCGPRWQCRYSHVGQITVCEIGIDMDSLGMVWRADGAGQSDIEAEKGALSDAFKRAAVRWGIGRYLYHLPSPWVEIEKRGKTSVIAKHEYARLEKILVQAGEVTSPTLRAALAADPPRLPPAEPDVEDAAKRWVAQQIVLLNAYHTDASIKEWDDKNERALHKLKLQHRELWDELAECRLQALESLRRPA